MAFEKIAEDVVYRGKIVTVYRATFRYDDDGEVAVREFVSHPGSVAMVAHDGEHVYLVEQPREPVDEQVVLELPAGKLDAEGEGPLETARRELAEEIGKSASEWELLKEYYASVGFTDEKVWVYLATGLADAAAEAEENERIEIVKRPLSELDALIDEVTDAKTIVGLTLLRSRLQAKG
jgi:8-oxo-dGTP pyrophosphatase MutT (NUDIX family)